MKFFVMLNTASGRPIPMLNDDSTEFNVIVSLFDTRKDAEDAADKNPLAQTYGFDIYEWIS